MFITAHRSQAWRKMPYSIITEGVTVCSNSYSRTACVTAPLVILKKGQMTLSIRDKGIFRGENLDKC
jgi:hypothetical protein